MKAVEELERLREKIESGDMPEDEPVFVLRARDLLAAGAVTSWAVCAKQLKAPQERVDAALNLAEQMRKWPKKQVPGRPDTLR